MNPLIVVVAVVAVIFFVAVYAVVNAAGTRLSGRQIDEDPAVRKHVDPDVRDDDFPVKAEY